MAGGSLTLFSIDLLTQFALCRLNVAQNSNNNNNTSSNSNSNEKKTDELSVNAGRPHVNSSRSRGSLPRRRLRSLHGYFTLVGSETTIGCACVGGLVMWRRTWVVILPRVGCPSKILRLSARTARSVPTDSGSEPNARHSKSHSERFCRVDWKSILARLG